MLVYLFVLLCGCDDDAAAGVIGLVRVMEKNASGFIVT